MSPEAINAHSAIRKRFSIHQALSCYRVGWFVGGPLTSTMIYASFEASLVTLAVTERHLPFSVGQLEKHLAKVDLAVFENLRPQFSYRLISSPRIRFGLVHDETVHPGTFDGLVSPSEFSFTVWHAAINSWSNICNSALRKTNTHLGLLLF